MKIPQNPFNDALQTCLNNIEEFKKRVECKHTSDIAHARNFIKGSYNSYWEKECFREHQKDCHGCFGAADDGCKRCMEENQHESE